MIVLDCQNVDEALVRGMYELKRVGRREESRNGPVLVAPCPVVTIYRNPMERVLTRRFRDANPFFHFYEQLWILAGRQDLAPLTRFVKRFASYSDDGGKTQNAAYGHRLRVSAGDQLSAAIHKLKKNRGDRRVVLSLHDPTLDTFYEGDEQGLDSGATTYVSGLGQLYTGRDAACNIAATLQVADGALHLVVFCRSNDIIWGCYGANAVHFAAILEYVATFANLKIGSYTQISVNWHAYVDVFEKTMLAMMTDPTHSVARNFAPRRMILATTGQSEWDEDVDRFVTPDGHAPTWTDFHDPFFTTVAYPIVRAHDLHKQKRRHEALKTIESCAADDWRVACTEWLERR